jgi:transposase-like protein
VPNRCGTSAEQAQIDANKVLGATSTELQRIKYLERENRDLKEAKEILKSASCYVGDLTHSVSS